MRKTYVDVSLVVLQEMLTPNGNKLQTTKGLPQGAQIVGATVNDALGQVRLFIDQPTDEPIIKRQVPSYESEDEQADRAYRKAQAFQYFDLVAAVDNPAKTWKLGYKAALKK